MTPLPTDEHACLAPPPAGHVSVMAASTPASRGEPRVYLRWRNRHGEMRVIPFRAEAARALAAELTRAADAIAASESAPIPVTP